MNMFVYISIDVIMPYNAKEPRKSVKSEWRMRAADFEPVNPPKLSGHMEDLIKKRQLENGLVMMCMSQLTVLKAVGTPYKLWTRDEPIPISPTDARTLIRAHLIRRVKK